MDDLLISCANSLQHDIMQQLIFSNDNLRMIKTPYCKPLLITLKNGKLQSIECIDQTRKHDWLLEFVYLRIDKPIYGNAPPLDVLFGGTRWFSH